MSSGLMLQHKKHRSSVGGLTRSLKHLFGTKNGHNQHKEVPKEYGRHYYLNENLCENIERVAKIERMSRKQAVETLVADGLSRYWGGKITEYIQNKENAREFYINLNTRRFIRLFRQFVRERGMDISKFI